jgi:apolipoprotein N-acyltransferase
MQRLVLTLSTLTGWRRMSVAFAAGAVSVLAMPPYHIWPVLLVTFPILVWLLDGCFSPPDRGWRLSRGEIKAAAQTGWAFGFGYFLAGLYWIGFAFLVEASIFAWLLPVAVTVMPAGLALFYAAAAVIAGPLWRPGPARIFGLAFALGLTELLRGRVLTGFPWNVPGYALTGSEAMMQSASVFSVNGLTIIAVMMFSSPATIWAIQGVRSSSWRTRLAPPISMAVLLASGMLWGQWRLQQHQIEFVDGVHLRLVQPSIPQKEKWKLENRAAIFQKHLLVSRKGLGGGKINGVTHLIWPESALPFLLKETPEALNAISDMMPAGSVFITGAARANREKVSQGSSKDKLQIFNSLFVMDHEARLLSFYDKVHLVPFGEYLPFQELLESIGLEQLARLRGGFAAGNGSRLTVAPNIPEFVSLICYEIIFPGAIRARDSAAKWMLNVTNDAWFGDSVGPLQHFHHARIRAVEEGLPLVRVANNGITAIVGPHGRISSLLPRNGALALDGGLPRASLSTVFANWGAIVVVLLMFLCLLAWVCLSRLNLQLK